MSEHAAELANLWVQGWYAPAQRLDSPNFGPRPPGACIDLLVIHSISLPPGQYGGQQVQALFTNQLDWDAHPYFSQIRGLQVSSHFYVRRDGSLWQKFGEFGSAWKGGDAILSGAVRDENDGCVSQKR